MKSTAVVTVRRVRPASAFRIGCLAGFLIWVVLGALYFLAQYLVAKDQQTIFSPKIEPMTFFLSYLISLACYPIIQGLLVLLYAWAYNTAVRSSGNGVDLEVEITTYPTPSTIGTNPFSSPPQVLPDLTRPEL